MGLVKKKGGVLDVLNSLYLKLTLRKRLESLTLLVKTDLKLKRADVFDKLGSVTLSRKTFAH